MRRPSRAALVQALLARQQASARAREAAGGPAQPKAIEARLALIGERVAEAFHRRAMEALGPILDRALERERSRRSDAIDELDPEDAAISSAMRSLEAASKDVARSAGIGGAVDAAARDLDSWNAEEIARQISIPVDSVAPDPEALDQFRGSAVGLIKDISEEQRRRIKDLVDEAQTTGMRVETLAKRLEDELGIAKNRARLIGRDQVLKANSRLTQDRMQAAGFKRYRWSSGTDARVRPMHRELDGQVFSWDDPPVTNPQGDRNHPGQDYQCRCGFVPVFEDDTEEESAYGAARAQALVTGQPLPPSTAARASRTPRAPTRPRPRPARTRPTRRAPAPPRSGPPSSPAPPPPEQGAAIPQGLPDAQRETYERALEDLKRRPEGPQWGAGNEPKDGAEPPWKMVRGLGEGWTSEEIRAERPTQREWDVIALLMAEGNAVIRRAPIRNAKSADLYVNGAKVEVKSLVSGGANAVVKAVQRASKQARSVVCDVRGEGLAKSDLAQLKKRLAGTSKIRQQGLIDFVRIIGDNFDVTWDFRQQISS